MPWDAKTILLVEDQNAILSLYACLLRQEGFGVLKARNTREALLHCKDHIGPIHLLIADIFLPRKQQLDEGVWWKAPLNGLDLARQVRTLSPNTQVIFISGHTRKEIESLGGIPPGIPFLEKPFKPDALLRTVRELLSLPA